MRPSSSDSLLGLSLIIQPWAKASVEITFENERFLVVPQAAILALVRE